jgi:hypothetical protein
MTVPRPDSIENLLTYLHECAHLFLHKDDETNPKYLREFEAETWALKKMQAAGLALPDGLVRKSKERIANEIRGAVKRGTQRLDERAFKFALPCFHDFELPEWNIGRVAKGKCNLIYEFAFKSFFVGSRVLRGILSVSAANLCTLLIF